jgi:Glucodextranase, domain B
MRSPHPRAKVLVIAVAFITVALPVASASATTESTQITTPSGLTYPFVQEHDKLTIAGTATGLAVSEVEIRCYSGTEQNEYQLIAEGVAVVGGMFSVEASASNLPDELCQLRAVPQTPVREKLALPPGEPERFEGPVVAASEFFPETSNYYAASSTLTGSFYLGSYGLESDLYSPSGHDDAQMFYGEEHLTAYPPIETRSSVQVDATNVYVPAAARSVAQNLQEEAETKKEAFTPLTGEQSVVVHDQFSESTHQMTIEEEDPLVKCSPQASTYPPTLTSCTSFVSAGVKIERKWQTSDEDHVASMTETWASTDGAAHTVNTRSYNEMYSTTAGGVYEFPGEVAFAATKAGEAKTLPAGPGTILYKTSPSLSELGNGEDPQGAIVYDTAPSEPIKITAHGSATYNTFETPYQRTVPAGGSSTPLRMTFIQAFALTEVSSLAAAAIAGYHPSVSITAPANGATVSTPTVTVTGTASDTGALSSLTVNGAGVAVAATGGAWSTSATLKPGANTITATATDQAGLSSSSVVTVTYTPPMPPPAKASQVGRVSGAKGQATITLACHGAAGTSCKIHATLTTVEKRRHGHLIAVVAAKTHSKQVTIATVTVVIPAGQKIKISLKLNATGRKLLARFGKLPAHLIVTLEGAGGHHTVIAQNLTIKPKPKPKKHKH